MSSITTIKNKIINFLEHNKLAGSGSNTYGNKLIRDAYIKNISEKFDDVINNENAENWTNLLACLMQHRIDLYKEPTKKYTHVSSAFGDALRVAHESLLTMIDTDKENPIFQELQKEKITRLEHHKENFGPQRVWMQLPTSDEQRHAKASRLLAAALGNSEVLALQSPKILLTGGVYGMFAKFSAYREPVLTKLSGKLYESSTEVERLRRALQDNAPTDKANTTPTNNSVTTLGMYKPADSAQASTPEVALAL